MTSFRQRVGGQVLPEKTTQARKWYGREQTADLRAEEESHAFVATDLEKRIIGDRWNEARWWWARKKGKSEASYWQSITLLRILSVKMPLPVLIIACLTHRFLSKVCGQNTLYVFTSLYNLRFWWSLVVLLRPQASARLVFCCQLCGFLKAPWYNPNQLHL